MATYKHVQHPAKGCTSAQIKAFEQIALGNCGGYGKKTIDALIKKGLIVYRGKEVLGVDRFGKIEVPFYEVPIHHHIVWCNYVSQKHE